MRRRRPRNGAARAWFLIRVAAGDVLTVVYLALGYAARVAVDLMADFRKMIRGR
jgi:hypothetical protein